MTGFGDVIRPARAGDLERVREIQHSVPSREFIGLAGTERAARRLGRALTTQHWLVDPSRPVVVLERDGEVVAFLKYVVPGSPVPCLRVGEVCRVLGAVGVRSVRLPARTRAQSRVAIPIPPDSLHLQELHTHPDLRGRGIGGNLLEWSAERRRELGSARRSLETGTANPARRLYERHGFRVVETTEDEEYERFFGQSGRVLMVSDAPR